MAHPPLSIRNFTVNPIELKLLERFEAPSHHAGGLSITRTLTGIMNITSPTSPQLALKSETFSHEDLSILIEPFSTITTAIQPKEKEVLRLTFEVSGQRYRVDTPFQSERSLTLTPLSPDPSFEYTAVFLPKSTYLSLFSSMQLSSWMSKLSDSTPLSALSIPGTHNSPAHYPALPSVRCQAVSILSQLQNGVRFLDIRVQVEHPNSPSKDGLILVHSAFPISLTGTKYLREILDIVLKFLDDNPSETVIISLKREGVGKGTDQQLSVVLHDHYATRANRWFTDDRIPTLGEARNKIVVIRRFALDESLKSKNAGKGWAIDAESWPDNCADGMCNSGEIRVQDFYEVAEPREIEKKILFSTEQLGRAAEIVCPLPGSGGLDGGMDGVAEVKAVLDGKQLPFFMNFLSASNFWKANCWPEKIAQKVNPAIVEFLCKNHGDEGGAKKVGDGGTGIVVCDWVGFNGDWDLVRCVVGMNSKLEYREKQASTKP
jgi:1-phosphatidylinositol phosphodiesterase